MKRTQTAATAICLFAIAGFRIAFSFGVDDKLPAAPPPSKYAPAEDLLSQVDLYLQHIDETLANKADFDEGAKSRLKKDANTLAALFGLLEKHDTDNRFKPKKGVLGLSTFSLSLANASDFDAAVTEFKALRKRASPENETFDVTVWPMGRAVSVEQLMKQVTTVNSALKRGVAPAKFESQKTQSAGQSATLAAIAEAIIGDTRAVKNPADTDKWYKFSAEMRDAAGSVNAAVHAGDQAATATAMSGLAKSCEACHNVFRKER